MTWAIGTPTVFGYGLLMADIQATLNTVMAGDAT